VADDPRPPVAIRITRPYATEDEYLEQELDLLSRTGITLVGAQPRPQGVVLRFELVLSGGQVLVRGEGRVVAFKPSAHGGVGGLTLRFTRIDARSKALLDKAAALREQRRPMSSRPSPPPASASTTSLSARPHPLEAPRPPDKPDKPPSSSAGPIPDAAAAPPPPPKAPLRAPSAAVTPPRERDLLLERLRARAKTLDGTAVRKILEQRRAVRSPGEA